MPDYRWRIPEKTNWIGLQADDAHATKLVTPFGALLEVRSAYGDRWVTVVNFRRKGGGFR